MTPMQPVTLFLPRTLFLDPFFVADDTATTSLIRDLYGKLDKRKKGVSNWKACFNVIAGILALRHHGTFKVIKLDLSEEHALAWEAVKSSPLMGDLFQFMGGKGRNEYRVHPDFKHPSQVRDTRTGLGFRVTGFSVVYGSAEAIQHPSQVRLMNGRQAVSCEIKSAQTVLQRLSDGLELPPRYRLLSPEPEEIIGQVRAADWIKTIQVAMRRYGYVGVVPSVVPDYNTIPIVLLADFAHEFNDWAYQTTLSYWREQKLPSVTFPMHIYHENWTQIIDGQPVQRMREQMAGIR